jgi:DNA-binding LytR/AlgR family response regulator
MPLGQLHAFAGSRFEYTDPPIQERLYVLDQDKFAKVHGANEVLAFQAEGDVVWIVTAKQRYLATQSLRKIQEKLQGSGFRRVHRNALVNADHIRKMAALSSNRWLITLSNSQEFVVSKRMARNVRQILSW